MQNFAKTTALVAVILLGVASGAAAQVSVGITIGRPPAPRVVRVQPANPGPGYVWMEGYWYPVGKHYTWHKGYWTRPPYETARWVGPHHDGKHYFAGYWEGDRGRVEHDHHSDRRKDRDSRHDDHR
jgi:hypothetical protein